MNCRRRVQLAIKESDVFRVSYQMGIRIPLFKTGVHFLTWLCILVGILTACSDRQIYHIDVLTLEKPLHKDSVLSFTFFIDDTSKVYAIKSVLFYSNEYPYSNLYLQREIIFETKTEYRDTANYILFDPYGKMTGKGFSNVKKLENSIGKGPLKFRNIGYYNVELNHLMRIDSLPGISKIGILITEIQ